MCVRVCVREREAETNTQMHPDCDTASHSHDLQFLLDYQQMEIRLEYAATLLMADRSDLRPLHQPGPGCMGPPFYDVVCLAQE